MTVATLDRAPAIPRDDLLRELLFREEAMVSLSRYIEYVSGMKPPRHLEYVCRKLEDVANGKIKRLMISMPVGHAKSFTASQHFPAWFLSRFPTKNIICASHTQDLSDSFGLKIKNIIRSDEHQRIFPESGISTEKSGAAEWMTLANGSYKATGVGSSITGRRGDLLLADDLISGIEGAESESNRKRVWDWWNSDYITRWKDDQTPIILIGTRWHLQDIFGRLEAEEKDGTGEKWEKITLPALAKKNDPLGRKEGEALWPSQFSRDALLKIKGRSGTTKRMWASIYDQNPVVEEGGIIDGRWFKVYKSTEPPVLKYIIQSWDTALTAQKQSAYSACTTWGVWEDDSEISNLILLSAWRDRVEWPELRKMARRLALDYRDDNLKIPIKPKKGRKPDTVLVEAKANGQALIHDLGRGGITATPFNPDKYGDKVSRVRLSTDLLENGRVWLPGQPPTFEALRPWAQEFKEQAVAFPASDSRDWVDTMAQMILRIKASGWVVNTENPTTQNYTNSGGAQRTAFY